jgi:wyosine [tRNA(Phe)-imidazoG37] synthetase (radical SAM superfamily)
MEDKVGFTSVYGPVRSWRYGRSLGIDPIGTISTCSFHCVYCQLGAIERLQLHREVFLPTERILEDLEHFMTGKVDCITLSGSGEPTLALNLGDILRKVKLLTQKPIVVLTNGTLLGDRQVRQELGLADRVAVKLDAVTEENLQRIDRPIAPLTLGEILPGIEAFRREYGGELAIQTMILSPWDEKTRKQYIETLTRLQPAEIQLNTPSRPKPVDRQLDGRGNHAPEETRPYAVRQIKCVSKEVLQSLGAEIERLTSFRVRCAP